MRFATFLSLAAVLIVTGTADASPSQVPLPGSLALVLTGVAGVVSYAWWVRRKK
jgi:hypothetical protein